MAMGFGEFQCNFLFHVDIFVCLFTYLIFFGGDWDQRNGKTGVE